MSESRELWPDDFLDQELEPAAWDSLRRWLADSPDNQESLARAILLHDRLRFELRSRQLLETNQRESKPAFEARRFSTWAPVTAAGLLFALALAFTFWPSGLESQAQAAAELGKLIAAQSHTPDRTFEITVEKRSVPRKSRYQPDPSRPPKPSLDGARLHVRSDGSFVLIRQPDSGETMITGSNGQGSWAIRAEGPVRVSRDPGRFNRDLPGHEQEMPLVNLRQGLEKMLLAYEVQPDRSSLSPEGSQALSPDLKAYPNGEVSRLVGRKRRGFPGPARVEIVYHTRTEKILDMRFVEMPFGPERLTIRMTLINEGDFGPAFFEHTAHHAGDRTVVNEDP